MQVSRADEVNGTYKLHRLSGSLYIQGDRDSRYHFNYGWGNWDDYSYFDYEKHSYPIPPEGMLAAALGKDIVVKNKRIRVDAASSRAEIVKAILRDPRLNRVMFFNLKSVPEFHPFKRFQNGVHYTRTRHPLLIEVGLEAGTGVTRASAVADYRVKIRGKKLVVDVTFRGKGGPLNEDYYDYYDYNIEGTARITALRK